MARHELALDGDWIERNISDLVEAVKSDASLKEKYFKVAWKCPVCNEAMCVKFGNKDSIRTGKEPHFCHMDGASPLADHEPETERHRNAKLYFKDVFAKQLSEMLELGEIASFDWPKTEAPLCDGKSRADVCFSFVRNDWTRFEYAIEVQHSPIDPSGFEHRHRTYESHWVRDIWIMWTDFLGSSWGSYVKPAWIVQILFDSFGYVSFFDIEAKRMCHAFALPERRRIEFPLGPKSPTLQTYMYCPEMAPENCRFRKGRCLNVSWDGDASLENHIRAVESHTCGPWYIDIVIAGQDAAVPSYRLDDGVPCVRSRLSDLSKARFEKEFAKKEKAYNDTLEIEGERNVEFSPRTSAVSS